MGMVEMSAIGRRSEPLNDQVGRKAAVRQSLTFGGIGVTADQCILGKKLAAGLRALKSLDFLNYFWYRMDFREHRCCVSVTT